MSGEKSYLSKQEIQKAWGENRIGTLRNADGDEVHGVHPHDICFVVFLSGTLGLRVADAYRLLADGKVFDGCAVPVQLRDVFPPEMLEVDDLVTAATDDTDHGAYLVVQEGGASSELYVHVSASREEAQAFREDCGSNGAYRTSEVIGVPTELAALGETFYAFVEDVVAASLDLDVIVGADDPDEEQSE